MVAYHIDVSSCRKMRKFLKLACIGHQYEYYLWLSVVAIFEVVKLSLHVIESFIASEACDIVMPLCALLLYIINPNTGH